jgi:hypothetical protein
MFSNVRAGAPAEKCRLRVADDFLWEIRLSLENWPDSH